MKIITKHDIEFDKNLFNITKLTGMAKEIAEEIAKEMQRIQEVFWIEKKRSVWFKIVFILQTVRRLNIRQSDNDGYVRIESCSMIQRMGLGLLSRQYRMK